MGHDSFKQIKMYSDYNSIMINGTFLKGFDIINYCRKAGNEALLPVAEFAEEWLQPNSEMVLKTSGSTGDPNFKAIKAASCVYSERLRSKDHSCGTPNRTRWNRARRFLIWWTWRQRRS